MSRCRTLCVGLLLAVFALPVATADARRITFGERDLRQGMRGTDVRVLQDFLTQGRGQDHGRRPVRPAAPRAAYAAGSASRQLPVNGAMTREDAATLRGQVEPGRRRAAEHRRRAARRRADRSGRHAGVRRAGGRAGGRAARGGRRSSPPPTRSWASRTSTAAATGIGRTRATTARALSPTPSTAPAWSAGPLNSTEFMSWGEAGQGSVDHELCQQRALLPRGRRPAVRHRLQQRVGSGPKWSTEMRPADGYTVRHPEGL